jgi:hypothetical protein
MGPAYDGALTYILKAKAESTQAEAAGVFQPGEPHRRHRPPALQ